MFPLGIQPSSGIAGLYGCSTFFSVTVINKRSTYWSLFVIEGIQGRNLRQEP